MKVAISIGHRPARPGYKVKQISEYSELAPMAGYLIQMISQKGHLAYIIGTGILQNKVAHINKLKVDMAVELHLNAGGGHGAETLYCPGSKTGKILAQKVQDQIVLLGMRDRGVKEGWFRMDKPGVKEYVGDVEGDEKKDYFLERTNCPAVIVEPYFLDNNSERMAYVGNSEFYKLLADRIVNGILNFKEEVSS